MEEKGEKEGRKVKSRQKGQVTNMVGLYREEQFNIWDWGILGESGSQVHFGMLSMPLTQPFVSAF